MKQVTIYTDGACIGNPGPGGYAAILQYKDQEKVICGGLSDTTNNRMELSAVIEGIKALKVSCEVHIYSDSAYIVNAVNKGWIKGWQRSGWHTSDNKPVKNQDLWVELIRLMENHKVIFHWVKGHSGDLMNERCDQIATSEAHKCQTM